MAVTVSRYNHTLKLWFNNELNLANLKIMLLDSGAAAFDATDTDMTAYTGASPDPEVFGNGWTEGGETLANVTVAVIDTNDANLDADDVAVTATGGDIGPARYAVIYDVTGDYPLWHYDFGQDETAGQDTDFRFVFNSDGIFKTTE